MKKILLFASILIAFNASAQVFSTLTTTGYNLDAVAENTTAVSTTGGAIDGSNYVLYSAAYAAYYTGATGLPNNGLISSGTRTYQLQPYTANNMLYLTIGLTDSLIFSTPAQFGALSILGFATEGAGSANITVRFTDNSTQVFSSQSLPDWFNSGNTVISGFDRCGRTSGTPNYQTTNPKMYYIDLLLNCANRQKNISNVKFQNTSANARLCIMAVSGATTPSFSTAVSPVTCSGGTNGSATITPAGGLGPYNYTVSSSPTQYISTPGNLPTGAYTYTAQDAAACPLTGTFSITQSLVAQPALNVTASSTNICAGSTITLSVSGAGTYTWNNSSNASTFTFAPPSAQATTFTVSGLTVDNCLRTGSVNITVNALPVLSLNGLPAATCKNSPTVAITVSPAGGFLAGQGLNGNTFDPSNLLPGTYTLSYSYTDANNCAAMVSQTITINAVPVLSFALLPGVYCVNASTVSLSANPQGGSFSGTGVSGSVFSPSMAGSGTTPITYSFTDANNCSASAVATATINPLPVLSFSMAKTFYCSNASSVPLNSNPSTGIYSGAGVNGNFFSPAGAGAGTHTIVYTYTNINGCTNKASVSLTVSSCTGFDMEEKNNISFFPNPSNGSFTIKGINPGTIRIIDETGREVRSLRTEPGENHLSVDNLPEGIYFVITDNAAFRRKVVVTGTGN